MELDKLKELILSRLFFILGALLILIGVGYTLAEKLKDNPIILSIIIFFLGLPFIALPYKYKSKLSNFFFIGFQVIGLSILYLDTILSAVVFNIIPLTYSLIIVFLISLLGIALSIINKSNELMILSTIGVYSSVIFPDIPLNQYLNKFLIFTTSINLLITISSLLIKKVEVRYINLSFFILAVIVFFFLKGIQFNQEYIPKLAVFFTINFILFYINSIIGIIKESKMEDIIYFILVNVVYYLVIVSLIKLYDFTYNPSLANISKNMISFFFSFIFTIFISLNYWFFSKGEKTNIIWAYYNMLILFIGLTLGTLLSYSYWLISWLIVSVVSIYIYTLNKNPEYKDLYVSSYIFFLILFILYYIVSFSDQERIIFIISTFLLNILVIYMNLKLPSQERIVNLANLKYLLTFIIGLLILIISGFYSYSINTNEEDIVNTIRIINILLTIIVIFSILLKSSDNLTKTLILLASPFICGVIFIIFFLIWDPLSNILIFSILLLTTLVILIGTDNILKFYNQLMQETSLNNIKIFNLLNLANKINLMFISIILLIELLKIEYIDNLNRFYLILAVYSIISIALIVLYMLSKEKDMLIYFKYSLIIYYILIFIFLIHLFYPLLVFEHYHRSFISFSSPILNLRAASYILLIFNSILIYYLVNRYKMEEDLTPTEIIIKDNTSKNTILSIFILLLILVIQEIFDLTYRLNIKESLITITVLIISSIYGTALGMLYKKDNNLVYLRDASFLILGIIILLLVRAYLRGIENFTILLIITGIYLVLFSPILSPKNITSTEDNLKNIQQETPENENTTP
jgi:hypothetical protein